MDDTQAFVDKVHDTQKKAEKNKQNHGKGTPSQKLPNKQHSKQNTRTRKQKKQQALPDRSDLLLYFL